MKILFLVESLRAGGKERRLSSLINNLVSRDNIELELILFDQEIHYEILDSPKFKVHIVKRLFKKDILSVYKVCKICNKFKPDIVNPWGIMPAFYSIFLKFLFRIPILNNQITDAPLDVRLGVHDLTLFFSDLIISNSKAGLYSYNVSSKKSVVIYNGFNFKRLNNLIDPNFIRQKYNLSNDLIIGMVASFSEFKDYNTYLKSAQLILKKHNNIKFLCIGGGDKSDYIKSVKKEFLNKIIFIDKQRDIESLINVFDIGVLSTYTEGISNSLMEYMALKKPVVTTLCEGTSELVENNKSGFLVQQKNPVMMKNCLETLINNPNLRQEMGECGRNIIEKKFHFKLMLNYFYKTFKKYSN